MINPFYLDLTDREISHIQDRLGEIFRGGNLILGRYPNTQVMYNKNMDVSQYVGLTKDKSIINSLQNLNRRFEAETV